MGGCIPAGLNAPWLVDGAFALPSVLLFSCPGGPALTEVVEQTLEGLHHSEMAELHLLCPFIVSPSSRWDLNF